MGGFSKICVVICVCFSACGSPAPHPPVSPPGESETWYGAYIGDQRVGYVRRMTGKTADGGVRLYTESFISAKALDRPVSMRSVMTLEATSDWKPVRLFEKIESQSAKPFTVRGERQGDKFHIEMFVGGARLKERTFGLNELTFPELADNLIRQEDMSVGKEWSFVIPNPADFLPIRMTIRVEKLAEITVRGVPRKVFQVISRLGAVEEISYVDTARPEPYRLEIPAMELVCVLEDKKTAEQISELEPADIDLIYFSAVIPSRGGTVPDTANHARVRLHGVSFDGLHLDGDYQKVDRGQPDGLTLDILRPDPSVLNRQPAAAPPGRTPLDTSALTPAVRRLAEKFRRSSPLEFTREAFQWMQKNIRKEITPMVSNAADVLDLKQGDCTEFAALFHALATAAGFPCKIVSGVMCVDGQYFYHSWNEILAGDEWVPVDPSNGEIPASPKHIKLIEGDLLASWPLLQCLRKLQIDILDVN